MEHLFDTCTLLNELNSPSNILDLGAKLKEKNDKILITNIVREELEPHGYLRKSEHENSIGIIHGLEQCEKNLNGVKTIKISDNINYKNNYENIRKRYYSHISAKELRNRVSKGEVTTEQAKKLKRKDCGECSCIAIAITDPKNICIVSEDEGRVCEKPSINIFNIYRRSHELKVYKFISWLSSMKVKLDS